MFEDRMQAFRLRFAERARSDLGKLTAALQAEDWMEARAIAHGLAGTGAVFGFPDLSAKGSELETAIDEGRSAGELQVRAEALCTALRSVAQLR